MITIQIHGVEDISWQDETGNPRILIVQLDDGTTQEIVLFNSRGKECAPPTPRHKEKARA